MRTSTIRDYKGKSKLSGQTAYNAYRACKTAQAAVYADVRRHGLTFDESLDLLAPIRALAARLPEGYRSALSELSNDLRDRLYRPDVYACDLDTDGNLTPDGKVHAVRYLEWVHVLSDGAVLTQDEMRTSGRLYRDVVRGYHRWRHNKKPYSETSVHVPEWGTERNPT